MNDRVPRISIGMPAYNAEEYVSEAIESILAQTFEDFELVISDNASTDGTEAICRDYASRDPRIRYFRAERNHGVSWNFNRVVELARGEYFKWAACDDVCAPGFLARCVQVLDRHRDVIWCHPRTAFIDSTGNRLTGPGGAVMSYATLSGRPASRSSGVSADHSSGFTRQSIHPHKRFGAVLLGLGYVHDVYGLIRTAELRKTGLERPFYGSDRVLVAELSLLGRFAEVPEVLFFSRCHADQVSFIPSCRDLERETSGGRGRRWVIPRRIRCIWWYFLLILKARLTWYERLRCLGVLGHFAVCPRKWKRLAIDGLRAVGLRIRVPEDALCSGGARGHRVSPPKKT